MRTISSLRRAPSRGRRLLATASLAAFAIIGVTVSVSPSLTATHDAPHTLAQNASAMLPSGALDALTAPPGDSPAVVANPPPLLSPSAPSYPPAGDVSSPAAAHTTTSRTAATKSTGSGSTTTKSTAPKAATSKTAAPRTGSTKTTAKTGAPANTAPKPSTPAPASSGPAPSNPAPGAGAAGSPPPAGSTVDVPTVTLTASKSSVHAGKTVSFTATATHADGTPIDAEVVRLQRASNGAWTTLTSATLAANGVATMSIKPKSTATYRIWLAAVTVGGANVADSAASASVEVKATLTVGQRIVKEAAKFKGRPYVFGAAGPKSFDCSGLVLYVFKKVTGLKLPHKASLQAHYGVHVSRKDAKPGDLIFFHTRSGYVHHVAIYTGHDMMWEAPHTGSHVRHVKIWSNAIEFRRLTK